MPDVYIPRLSVELTEETYWRMKEKIPWGLTSKVMVVLLEGTLDLIDEHGNIVLAAILNQAIGAKEVVKELREVGKNGTS